MNRRKFTYTSLLGLGGLLSTPLNTLSAKSEEENKVLEVLKYIKNTWESCIYQDKNGSGFEGIDLPSPYTSPSIKGEGHFTAFFYWDTYFTNLGLMKHGRADQVQNNIKNMLWFIDEMGFMPNFTSITNRSQPPYLQLMVRDYLEKDNNEVFYKDCAEGLRKEYQFWMTARRSKMGLNHYSHHDVAEECITFYNEILVPRLKLDKEADDDTKIALGGHFIAEAESAWDFCQRFDGRCMDHAAIDLNALLYGYEDFLYKAAKKLNWYHKDMYLERAQERIKLINKNMWNKEKGWFFDYNFVNKKQSEIFSLAGMQPMFMGMASKKQAKKMVKNLSLFEGEFGIAVTPKSEGCENYQWAYPNVWPPMVYTTVKGLADYGYHKHAKRIAQKYIAVNTALFHKHGKLFEKTNVETGELSNTEYNSTPMMGWTAGVYVAFAEYLDLLP